MIHTYTYVLPAAIEAIGLIVVCGGGAAYLIYLMIRYGWWYGPMTKRKHISWKTKCASALMEVDWLRSVIHGKHTRLVPYDHATQMTETQFHSLWQWDHNKLHVFVKHKPDADHFSNLTPEPIMVHREKTKQDAKIISKSKRIRKKWLTHKIVRQELLPGLMAVEHRPKIRSRGFDKTLRKKVSGKVEKR
jgi:hypothetical protein